MHAQRHSQPTYKELEAKLIELEHRLGQAFSAEEMDVLREQLSERAELAEAARETLERRLRIELQRVHEAEARCSAAARELRQVASAIASFLDDSVTLHAVQLIDDESPTMGSVTTRRRALG